MALQYCEFLRRMHMLDRQSTRRKKIYKKRFNPITELNDKDFKSKYTFSKNSMQKLIAIVEKELKGDNRGGHIPVNLRVMASLRYWICNELQDDAAHFHGLSQSSLSKMSARVGRAFASKAGNFISMPETASEQKEILDQFKAISGFPEVIGAIDCTHIRIRKQGGESGQYYVNRNGHYSINVQVVCDPDLKIKDIVYHWHGSAQNSDIYEESSIKKRLEMGVFPGRLLGNEGYACTNHLFTPVQNPANSSEEKYNIAHAATRNTIDRTFQLWKSRFRILQTGMRGSLDNVKTTVVALAVLHNLAIEFNEDLDEEDDSHELNDDEDIALPPENQLLPHDQKSVRSEFINSYFT